MTHYLGTKSVLAKPMTRGEYNTYRGWEAPPNEEQATAGYLVEYQDGCAPNRPDHKGYISWSPADVFAKSYRPTFGLNFGLAVEALKLGHRVARAGWNGKGMWIALSPGGTAIPAANFWSPQNRRFAEEKGGTAEVLPVLTMKTADDKILPGWLASQSDMLADDWEILDAA